MTNLLTNGFGGTAASDVLATARPVYLSGYVYFVSSTTGNDSNAGTNREAPLATLATAASSASDGDVIVLMTGHAETLHDVTIPANVTVVGEGVSAGVPTVVLTPAAVGTDFAVSMRENSELRNVKFETWGTAKAKPVVLVGYPGVCVSGCHFDCGATCLSEVLSITTSCAKVGDYCTIDGCVFASTATTTSPLPSAAIAVQSAVQRLTVSDTVIDDGVYGFSADYAIMENAIVTASRYVGISHLRGASTLLNVDSVGYYNPQTNTGGGRVVW